MRIVDARVIVCSPGRNFVTLKLVTEDGLHGLGDATLNGRELAVASYLQDHVVPLLIGRDARRIEDTWQYLYKGAYWRRGPVTMTAIAAVDMALWDILGKAANMPVYRLLGGASREARHGLRPRQRRRRRGDGRGGRRTTWSSATRPSARSAACPAWRSTYGVGRGGMYYEPAERGLPPENVWSTEQLPRVRAALFARAAPGVRPRRSTSCTTSTTA